MWRPFCISNLKRYQTVYEFKRAHLKNQNLKLRAPYFAGRGEHRKPIKVIKVLCVKSASVTGIAKGVAMARNNRCVFVCYECLVLKYGTLTAPNKLTQNLLTFNIIIKKWSRVQCECTICQNSLQNNLHPYHFY